MNDDVNWWMDAQRDGLPLGPYTIKKGFCSACGATWKYRSPSFKVVPGTVIDIHKCGGGVVAA